MIAELGGVALQAPDDLDEARRPTCRGRCVLSSWISVEPSSGRPNAPISGERDREQRQQREQRVVGDHRRQVRAAVGEEVADDRRARAARAGAAASDPGRAGLEPPPSAQQDTRSRTRAREPALGRRDVAWALVVPSARSHERGTFERARSPGRPEADLGAGHRRGDRRAARARSRPPRCRTAPRASGSCAWAPSCGRRPSRLARDLGRDALSQVEVATPEGSVFVLRDAARTIVATTTVDPIVGPGVLRPAHVPAHRRGGLARGCAVRRRHAGNGPREGFDGAA